MWFKPRELEQDKNLIKKLMKFSRLIFTHRVEEGNIETYYEKKLKGSDSWTRRE